jgi:hypothetical protein
MDIRRLLPALFVFGACSFARATRRLATMTNQFGDDPKFKMNQEGKERRSISRGSFCSLGLEGCLFIPLFTELPAYALSPVPAIPLWIGTSAALPAVPMSKFLAN